MTAARIEEAGSLLHIAHADFAACLALLDAPRVRFASSAFHGQQAAEKCLKAVPILHGMNFGRTHNLVALAGQLAEVGQPVPVSVEHLSLLNPYAVTLRYDDIDVELVSPQTLRDTVETLIEWAKRSLSVAIDNSSAVAPAPTFEGR